MKKENRFWELSAAYLAGETSKKQEEEFQDLLSGSSYLKTEFEKMEREWKNFDSPAGEGFASSEKAWHNLKNRLEQDGLLEEKRASSAPGLGYFVRIAAIFLIMAGLGLAIVYISQKGELQPRGGQKFIASAGIMEVELADGSRVFLNKGAELKLNRSFPDQRKMKLQGEAYFEVAADPAHPFSVNAGEAEITVLGTSFNIREEANDVEVLVESGKVRLQNKKNSEGINLLPGQMGIAGNGRLTSIPKSNMNYLSWKTHEFRFVNENLEDVLACLGNAYHVEISTNELPPDLRLSTTYSKQSLESILETIATAFNLKYTRHGNRYTFEKK